MLKTASKLLLCIVYTFTILTTNAQEKSKEPEKDWHLQEYAKGEFPGISLKKAYKLLKKKKKKPSPIIVAVLDAGVDIHHEDLIPVLWKNKSEIPNNGFDDDENGYPDDVDGWNFIGGKDSLSVESETLELTRLYKKYKKQFGDRDKYSIQENEKEDYKEYLHFMKEYNAGKKRLQSSIERNQEEYEFFDKLVPPLQVLMGKKTFSGKQLRNKLIVDSPSLELRDKFFRIIELNSEKKLTSEKLIKHYEEIAERVETSKTRLDYNYSLEFDGRAIIGDDISNLTEQFYGNNDVSKRCEHGTHVAGIIGAKRKNKLGIDGIANNVLILPIRNTPMGDERDKDVANGIRYAVDNGAKIINMSFGKSYSPNKKVVDEAVLYAQEKGVLLVHGAGNSSTNTSYYYSYPSALLLDGTVASNWLEVGATSYHFDEKIVAEFSNYGKSSIDIFAPGVDIYSTLPDNEYDTRSGTSMASPVVAGVAALIWSHFPELTPEQIIEIITESGNSYEGEVILPGSDTEKIPFQNLSKNGKIINAYNAVKLALEKYSIED